mmetsp:Transcript_12635/g.19567  ORF Transcript_12635/g.19567 Transcript_12635/m.19567 type:complete len:331 (-) Transcript_12635:26-1018(-)
MMSRATLFLIFSVFVCTICRTSDADQVRNHVTVVGLGGMGKAVVKCFAKNGYDVHAWNRGERNRQAIKDLELSNVKIYEEFEKALEQSKIILMHIDAGNDLSKTNKLIKSTSDESAWKEKILIQFSSHMPSDAARQNTLMTSLEGNLVAGALIAVPETICSEAAMILVSASETSSLENTKSALDYLGCVVRFDSDVGLASLANVAIIQALTFGLAGHKMAHLLVEQYGAPVEVIEQYAGLATSVIPSYVEMLYEIVSKSIISKQWHQSYVPSDDVLNMLQMHARFIDEMGIQGDTYLEGYMKCLRKVTIPAHGPSAWIQHALTAETEKEL